MMLSRRPNVEISLVYLVSRMFSLYNIRGYMFELPESMDLQVNICGSYINKGCEQLSPYLE